MSIAKELHIALSLHEEKTFYELNASLNRLQERAVNVNYLLGSKRSYYDFEDDSRIIWHASINKFE